MLRHRYLLPAMLTALMGTGALTPSAAVAAGSDGAVEVDATTLSGSYLAGRSADAAHDLSAAARFFVSALRSDPGNPVLLERVVMLLLATDDLDAAFGFAERLVTLVPGNPISRVTLGARTMKAGDPTATENHLSKVGPAPLATLTAGLLAAWSKFGEGDVETALAMVDKLEGPAWYDIFKAYHSALLLDAAGRTEEALVSSTAAYEIDRTALRIVESHARLLARNGAGAQAIEAITSFAGEAPLHPRARVLLDALRSGLTPAPIVEDAFSGAAEVLYGLGSAIGTDDGPDLPAAYLRLASYLDPDSVLARIAVGDVFQEAGQCEQAIEIYAAIPTDEPMRRNADIQIGNCLEALDRPDEAAIQLASVVATYPADYEAAIELGNVYRMSQRYAEAADAYAQGIDNLPQNAAGAWRVYYFRGIAHERAKQWPSAEADFKHALELNPDQPQVLNYLGYSWVDMGENLEPALDMIRTAVDLRPNDGYIVDSLGWAYYRLERFADATVELERAAELRPEDPIINDHLGDALWQVGRRREAVFQWTHARDLEPNEADLPLILAKIEHGLGATPQTPVIPAPADTTAPQSLIVAAGDSLWSLAERLYGDGEAYRRLLEANGATINDPDMIFPGMKLRVPPADDN
ncbi:MAG: tetratricopeptide repeat protein [Alphaproteobacteria bacterium]